MRYPAGRDYLLGIFFKLKKISVKPLTTQEAVLEYEYDKTTK